MYYVYLLYSTKLQRWYVGQTADLERRVQEHNAGKEIATKSGAPWELMYYEVYRNSKDAITRERKLKHHGQGLRRLKERITK